MYKLANFFKGFHSTPHTIKMIDYRNKIILAPMVYH
jgi:hypothetical protein